MKNLFIAFLALLVQLLMNGCTSALVLGDEDGEEGVGRPIPRAVSERQLTSDPDEEYAPAWSPDGRYVAYTVKDSRGNFDIALIPAQGGSSHRLTTNPTYDGLPAWSPDSTEIAYESDRDFHADIWVMDLEGKNHRKLTRSREGHFTPVWRPDGRKILFERVPLNSSLSGNRELWVMDRSGANSRKLSDGFNPEERQLFFTTGHSHGIPAPTNSLAVSKPYEIFTCGLSWSPDGDRILFESVRGGSVSIWVMDSNGSNPTQLTRDLSNNWHPTWSPDGERIAFASDRSGNYDIWVMNADGSRPVPVTRDMSSDFRPSWSPDGEKIVYTSLRSGSADLWVVNLE